MGKKTTVSRTNKKIREIQAEAERYRKQSRKGLTLGFLTLGAFALIAITEQLLARTGIFGADHMVADNVAICLLMLVSFIGMHFWRGYSRENLKYKESLQRIRQYEKYRYK